MSLRRQGFEESLEVLPLLSQDQVTRIADFDLWKGDNLDRSRAIELLSYFALVSPKELYRRYAYLDEEYQIAILANVLEVVTIEEYEKFTNELQDSYQAMPCNQVFYRVKDPSDKKMAEFVDKLVSASCEHNLRYAYALLAYTAHAVPNEAEADIARFRSARLEEEGFVTFEESQQVFSRIDQKKLLNEMTVNQRQGASGSELPVANHNLSGPYLNHAFDYLQQASWSIEDQYDLHVQLLYLANSLTTAAGVEPDDTYGISRVLEQCQALVGLGLEYLSQGDLSASAIILSKTHPKTLFQCGLGLVFDLRDAVVAAITRNKRGPYKELAQLYAGNKWGAIAYLFENRYQEVYGFELTETLKGLFNRFPMVLVSTAEDSKRLQFSPLYSYAYFQKLMQQTQQILKLVESPNSYEAEDSTL